MFATWKLKKRLDSLEDTLEKLTAGFQTLELEWLNAYAKFKKIAGRIAKDQAVIDSRELLNPAEPTDVSVQGDGAPGGLLTPRQKQIQQQILKRRGGGIQ